MCKHCKLSELGETDGYILFKSKPIKVGRATIGCEDLCARLDRDTRTGKWALKVEHGIGNDASGDWDDWVIRTNIKYCPFCGEKLPDSFNEG